MAKPHDRRPPIIRGAARRSHGHRVSEHVGAAGVRSLRGREGSSTLCDTFAVARSRIEAVPGCGQPARHARVRNQHSPFALPFQHPIRQLRVTESTRPETFWQSRLRALTLSPQQLSHRVELVCESWLGPSQVPAKPRASDAAGRVSHLINLRRSSADVRISRIRSYRLQLTSPATGLT